MSCFCCLKILEPSSGFARLTPAIVLMSSSLGRSASVYFGFFFCITGATKPVPKFWKNGGGGGVLDGGLLDLLRLLPFPLLLAGCDATIAPAPPGGGGGPPPDGASAAITSSLLPRGLDAKFLRISFNPEPFACMCLIAFPKLSPIVCK